MLFFSWIFWGVKTTSAKEKTLSKNQSNVVFNEILPNCFNENKMDWRLLETNVILKY